MGRVRSSPPNDRHAELTLLSMARRASIRAFTFWDITPAEGADIRAELFAGLENGTLRPVVGKECSSPRGRARKAILEPASTDKIVLIC
jgi:NADPH:quinone reductase